MTDPDRSRSDEPDQGDAKTDYVRRFERKGDWIFGVVFLLTLPVALMLSVRLTPYRSGWILLSLPLGWIAASLLGHLAELGWLLHMRRRLDARRWQICESCGYDTSATGPAGTCPECGNAFDNAKLVEDFSLHLRRIRRKSRITRLIAKVR